MSEGEETSPLKSFQSKYCAKCTRGCNPNELAFFACVLAHVASSVSTIKEIV
jgi:hypothetical protein